MRFHKVGLGFAFCIILVTLPAVRGEDKPALAQTLMSLRDDGIVRRVSLSEVARTVQSAKRSVADEAVLDYAHGLVLLSRVQPAKAIACFESALKHNSAYLPAWQALLRTRLIRKDMKNLETQSLQLAKVVQSPEVSWQEESQRKDAAAWLGEVAGFLALPEAGLMKPEEQRRFEANLQQALGSGFASDFTAGKQTLQKTYEALRKGLESEVDQESENQDKKAEDELAELAGKSDELDEKAESLKLSADQWKDWLDERVKKADDELKTLEAEFQKLDQSAQGVSQLIQQTQLDVARYQTELAAQGIRGRDADQQPAMLQLRQELVKYQRQYQALEQRAARILLQGRQVLAARTLAVKKYQKATGKIVRESETLSRWKKSVEKASDKLESRDSKTVARSLKKRLSMPASYFELDEKAELSKMIEQAGGEP